MGGVQEAAEGAAQTVLDSVAADAASFPWVSALICYFVAAPILWGLVEALKAGRLAKLKRPPRKDASEKTVLRRITRAFPWYPVVIWAINVLGGAVLGLGIAVIDHFAGGHLGLWGAPFGSLAGVTNGIGMKILRGVGDKASDLLLGWAKRRMGNDGGEG